MKILIIVATLAEIQAFLTRFKSVQDTDFQQFTHLKYQSGQKDSHHGIF